MHQTSETAPAPIAPYAARPRLRLWSAVERFWFARESPAQLGYCRMLLFGLMVWFYFRIDYSIWATLPHSMANNPLFGFRALALPIVSYKTMAMLEGLWKMSLLTACVGLYSRLSAL